MRIKFFLLLSFFYPILFFSCKENQKSEQTESVALVSIEEKKFALFLDSLKQTGANDYQVINEIRKYLALRLDYGKSHDSLSESYHKIPWDRFSGFQCIALFEQNKLTSQCGLTSYVLAKLYDFAGYENYIYDCGYDTSRLSHEFNLVKLEGKLIVQDAFMDMTITNADDSPKDFIGMLSEIKKGDFSNVKIKEENITSEYWEDSLKKEVLEIYCSNEFYRAYLSEIAIVDNRVKIMLNRNYDFLAGWMLENLRQKFKSEGLSENFLSIYLKPMYLKDGNTGAPADSLLAIISFATNNGSQD